VKIGILGTRGIPNAYGGFEQFAQYLALGMVQKGHDVWVYNSSMHPYQEKQWNGIHLIHCKDWEDKIGTAGQFVYDYNCLHDAGKRNFDILLQLGYTSNSIWYPLWPKRSITVLNMDGLEWKRAKYNKITRRFLLYAESLAAKHGDVLIADSKGIQDYILYKYHKESIYIPYGAEIIENYDSSMLKELNVEANKYFLLIARMEPENNIETIIKGYLISDPNDPLIIIGGFKNKFGQYLVKKYQSKKLRFAGAIYDQSSINSIRHYSLLYFHGHSVGGTNPSLLEAMACSCNIAAHDNIFNKGILQEDAYYFFDASDVSHIIDLPYDEKIIHQRQEKNIEKIRNAYNWGKIIDAYENVFLDAVKLKA